MLVWRSLFLKRGYVPNNGGIALLSLPEKIYAGVLEQKIEDLRFRRNNTLLILVAKH